MGGGLIIEPPRPKDWYFGGLSGVTDPIRNKAGFKRYLDTGRPQSWRAHDGSFADVYACVSYALAASVTAKMNYLLDAGAFTQTAVDWLFDNGYVTEDVVGGRFRFNMSRRWLAKLSGTVPRVGNSLRTVAETMRTMGPVPETLWPTVDGMTEAEYYSDIKDSILEKGRALGAEFLARFTYSWEWVMPDDTNISQSLLIAPVEACVKMGFRDKEGLWHRAIGDANHAVAKWGADGAIDEIRDSYKSDGSFDRRFAPDFDLESTMLHDVNPVHATEKPHMFEFKEGYLYFVNDGTGILPCLYAAKMLRPVTNFEEFGQFLARNKEVAEPIQSRTENVLASQIEGQELRDFKGELVAKVIDGKVTLVGSVSYTGGIAGSDQKKPWYGSSVDDSVSLRLKGFVLMALPLVMMFVHQFYPDITQDAVTAAFEGAFALVGAVMVIIGQARAKK